MFQFRNAGLLLSDFTLRPSALSSEQLKHLRADLSPALIGQLVRIPMLQHGSLHALDGYTQLKTTWLDLS